MNVASKELCEELYKLSGWGYTHLRYVELQRSHRIVVVTARNIDLSKHNELSPAYDLGYLLRKLEMSFEGPYSLLDELAKFVAIGLSYEDAACSIAIESFKQRILTPELSSKEKENV